MTYFRTAYVIHVLEKDKPRKPVAQADSLSKARVLAIRYWKPGADVMILKQSARKGKHIGMEYVGEVYPARNRRYFVWENYNKRTTSEILSNGSVRATIKKKQPTPFGL